MRRRSARAAGPGGGRAPAAMPTRAAGTEGSPPSPATADRGDRRLVDDRAAAAPTPRRTTRGGTRGRCSAGGPGTPRPERRCRGDEARGPAHGAHVLVPRRAHVGRAAAIERRPSGRRRRCRPPTRAARRRAAPCPRPRSRVGRGQRGRGLDRPGQREDVRLDDDDDVVVADRLASAARRRSRRAAARRRPRPHAAARCVAPGVVAGVARSTTRAPAGHRTAPVAPSSTRVDLADLDARSAPAATVMTPSDATRRASSRSWVGVDDDDVDAVVEVGEAVAGRRPEGREPGSSRARSRSVQSSTAGCRRGRRRAGRPRRAASARRRPRRSVRSKTAPAPSSSTTSGRCGRRGRAARPAGGTTAASLRAARGSGARRSAAPRGARCARGRRRSGRPVARVGEGRAPARSCRVAHLLRAARA